MPIDMEFRVDIFGCGYEKENRSNIKLNPLMKYKFRKACYICSGRSLVISVRSRVSVSLIYMHFV